MAPPNRLTHPPDKKVRRTVALPPVKPTRRIAIVIEMDYALPWHQDCYEGVMRYGEAKGWRCVLDLTAAGVHGDQSRTDYDGVIGRIPRDVAQRVLSLGLPMVNLTRYVDANDAERFGDLPGVYIDRAAGARVAAQHLVQTGYPRMGMIIEEGYDHEQLLSTAQAVCAAHGVGWVAPFMCPEHVPSSLERQTVVMRAMARYLEALDKPVGLLVNSGVYARQAAHLCAELGLRVPEDVGIVARLSAEIILTSGSPTITSVDYDYFSQGYEAAAMLDQLMSGQTVHPMQRHVEPTAVVVRESTDVFLCEDELVSKAMHYVAAHVREDLNVSQLAQVLGVSRSTLYRRFEEANGRSPQDEINRLRVDYLKRLLEETDQSITQISNACGFSVPSQFTRYFKHATGQTPSRYRAGTEKQDRSNTRSSR